MTEGKAKKQKTADTTIAKISAHCTRNKAALDGKQFDVISAQVRKEFAGLFMTDSAIVAGMEAAGIQVIKEPRGGAGVNRSQAPRALAAIILRLCESIEVKANLPSLLSKEDIKTLTAIRHGKVKEMLEQQQKLDIDGSDKPAA